MSCPHGEPDSRCCLDCLVSAGFDGSCGMCHLEIHVGQKVVHTTRERWVHLACVGSGQ